MVSIFFPGPQPQNALLRTEPWMGDFFNLLEEKKKRLRMVGKPAAAG